MNEFITKTIETKLMEKIII